MKVRANSIGYQFLRYQFIRCLTVIVLAFTLSACSDLWDSSDSTKNLKVLKLPEGSTVVTKDKSREIFSSIKALDKTIGDYPPKYGNSGDDTREILYTKWAETLKKARGFAKIKGNNSEAQSLYFLSELYRQGHNLDVKESHKEASLLIDRCIDKFPNYLPCHTSCAKYYLSIKPTDITLTKAELSLFTLRNSNKSKLDEDVEYNFAILRASQGDGKLALKEIGQFLKNFPRSENRKRLIKLRDEIKKNP